MNGKDPFQGIRNRPSKADERKGENSNENRVDYPKLDVASVK
jgi:hypothetical protein